MSNVPAQIADSTVVITGASSGFGKGAALELARRGARVAVAARRSELLDELVSRIEADGGKAVAVTTDVSDPQQVVQLARRTIEKFGRIDVWVNNVGVGAIGYLWDIPLEVHARVVDVNLKGLIFGAHVALKAFIGQGGGTLVNMGSIDSEVPLALQNSYAATKAAVLSLSRSLNEELRLSGHADSIKVATIMPWAVDTTWWIHAANYTGHAPRMAMMDDPELVVDTIVKACTEPEEEMLVGPKARTFKASHRLFPDLTERTSASLSKKQSRKGTAAANTEGTLFTPMAEGSGIEGGIRERMKEETS